MGRECKYCKRVDELDKNELCWVCQIKAVDKIMEDREQRREPKPFLFEP